MINFVSKKLTHQLLLTVIVLLCFAEPTFSQESTTKTLVKDHAIQSVMADTVLESVKNYASMLNGDCTDQHGNKHAHGTTWTEGGANANSWSPGDGCPQDMVGTITYGCVHGQRAIQSSSCHVKITNAQDASGFTGLCEKFTGARYAIYYVFKCPSGYPKQEGATYYHCGLAFSNVADWGVGLHATGAFNQTHRNPWCSSD